MLLSFTGIFTLSAIVNAQATSPEVTQTVVTVNDRAMPLSETAASVTILDREFIRSTHADTAADLLRAAAFVDIAQNGASGGLTTLSIRGGKPNFTLVMIDGVPVNDITNLLGGAFDLSSLPVDNIERVEIVRGPLSSVYGSDAIAGVVNFISRKGSKVPVLDVSGEFGSFFRRQAQLAAAGTWKALQWSSGGTFLDVGQQVLNDAYSAGSLDFSGSVSLGPNRVLEFGARWLDDRAEGFPAGSGGAEYAIIRTPMRDDAQEFILGASLKGQVRPWWIYSLDLDRFSRTEDNVTPAVLNAIPPSLSQSLPASTSDTDFARVRFGATSHFLWPRHLSLDLGAGLRRESGAANGFLASVLPQAFNLVRTSLLANTLVQYSTERLTASAAFSFDKTAGYGEVTSPRLGITWLTSEGGPRLKSSWGEGFELPSFYALANPSVGNASLQPERVNSFDAGLEQRLGVPRILGSLTYFRNSYRDLINFDSATFRLENTSQAVIQGVELGADYPIRSTIRFGLDFTYQVWRQSGSTQPLRDIPHGLGGIHLDWKISNRLRARADTQWMGRRYDFQIPVAEDMAVGGYSNTEISGSYDLSRKFTMYLRADNLFDSKYQEYIGFLNPGTSVQFGIRYHALAK
ncbi:MAG TPA: TonB-dependent receptor [Bryobacteraceae bacterium]|nr:TonB-dependent receptor [Bryobacteraceae bacterium]